MPISLAQWLVHDMVRPSPALVDGDQICGAVCGHTGYAPVLPIFWAGHKVCLNKIFNVTDVRGWTRKLKHLLVKLMRP